MSMKSQLVATVSSACLVLYTSAPLFAQSISDILTDRAQESINAQTRYTETNAAHQGMMAVQSAHTMMTALVRVSKLRDDWQDEDPARFLAIEDFIKDRGTIQGYTHIDGSRPYQQRLHGSSDYHIRYRICGVGDTHPVTGLPERGYEIAVMTILPSLPVSFDTVEELVATAGLHQLRLRDVSLVPNDRRHGTMGVFNSVENKFSTFEGVEVDVPACLLDRDQWFLDSRDFDLETVAVVETVRPRELNFVHKDEAAFATDTALCRNPAVSANYGVPADAVIGQAQFERGRVRVSQLRDENPLTDEGTQINPANGTPSDLTDDGFIGDWTYVGGCRAPIENEGSLVETCTWTVAGQATESFRVWRVQQREVPPARGYYLDGEAQTYAPIAGTARFLQGLCDGDPVQPRVTETQASNVERQTGLQCTGSFPDGTWDRQRTYTDTTGRVANAQPPREWTTRTYDNWQTTRNGCSKTAVTNERQTQTVNGCLDQYRDVTVRTVSYSSGQAASVTRTDPAWINSANRCNTGSSNSGSDTKYIDIDRDGIGDIPESGLAKWARENGFTVVGNNNLVKDGVTTYTSTSTNCNFKCDGSSATGSSGDQNIGTTDKTGGGLGGFLSNAWNSIKNAFSGGSSSSGGSSGGGGGGGSNSCFVAGTLVAMADGSFKAIETIMPDDIVLDGGAVLATMQFMPGLIYDLYGVLVSGSHLVAHDGKWIAVEDHPDAVFLGLSDGPIYNLATENNTIICGGVLFADHLEVAPGLVEEALALTREGAMAELSVRPTVKSKFSALKAKVLS